LKISQTIFLLRLDIFIKKKNFAKFM